MSVEPEFNAHVRCTWCHGLKAKADVIICDDKPICKHNSTCKEKFYETTRPRSWLAPVDDPDLDI